MNERLREMIGELLQSDDMTIRESKDNLIAALRAKGCTEEEITETTKLFEEFPLNDKNLESVTGGGAIPNNWAKSNAQNYPSGKLLY